MQKLNDFVNCLLFIVGFSLATFLTSEGLTTLTDPVISQLSEDLGLSTYLNSPTCDRSALPYKPKVNGWNNGRLSEKKKNIAFMNQLN